MKSKGKILAVLPIIGVLAILMSLVALIPAFAATRGTVALLDPSDTTKALVWGRVGGTVILEVRDADLDVAKVITGALAADTACSTDATKCENATVTAGAADSTTLIVVANKPILDRNGDTLVNTDDVTITDTSDNTCVGAVCTMVQAISVDASNGVITIKRVSTLSADKTIRIRYNSAALDSVGSTTLASSSVKVTSNADSTGIGVVLGETGPSTGIFRATLNLVSTDSVAADKKLKVATLTNDTVKLSYTDAAPTPETTVTVTVPVESFVPVFANFSPANKTGTQVSRPEVTADVTDNDSGVKKTSVKIWWGLDTDLDANSVVDSASEDVVDTAGGTLDAITLGYRIKQRITGTVPSTDFRIFWWVLANDTAGNLGVSDRTPSITESDGSVTNDPCDPTASPWTGSVSGLVGKKAGGKSGADSTAIGGCQPYQIRIDFTAPTMSAAITGQWWDTSIVTNAEFSNSLTDKTNGVSTKALKTSIVVNFNEDIDSTTVDAADFTVDGVAPSAAVLYSDKKTSVFLTVAAMSSSAKPVVKIVGSIKDTAGNNQTAGEVTSGDGIAPAITVTGPALSTETIPVTKDKITIQFSTDEDVNVDVNSVTVKEVNATAGVLGVTGGNVSTASPTLVSTRTWKVDVTPGTAGLFNVYVTATDVGGRNNVGTKGKSSDPASTSAYLFERDVAVPAPVFIPASLASTDDPNGYIIVQFINEGKEYGIKADGTWTTTAADVSTTKDTHKKVTLTSATLDGVDILSSINTADNISFLYKASGLALGDHTIKVKAKDEAGNELAETSNTFKVIAKELFEVKLNPGWNLVSLPNSPADPSINSVISSDLPISTVISYDPSATGGPWLTAVKDATTGKLTGTLTQITAGKAYWMLTTTFQSIKVDIPKLAGGQQATPPTVNLVEGWNLVPAIDITGKKKAGDKLDTTSAQYLANITFSRIYEFDTINSVFTAVLSTDQLKVGLGYWVFVTKAGVLVP